MCRSAVAQSTFLRDCCVVPLRKLTFSHRCGLFREAEAAALAAELDGVTIAPAEDSVKPSAPTKQSKACPHAQHLVL